jgi:hypothetical protein
MLRETEDPASSDVNSAAEGAAPSWSASPGTNFELAVEVAA